MMAGRVVAASLYAVSLGAAASAAYPIFATPQFWVAGSVTMIAGILIAGASLQWDWSPLRRLAATLLALLALGPPLAASRDIGEGAILDALATSYSAVWRSWRRLTTIDLPVGTDDGLLMAPIVLILPATVFGIWLIFKARRGELALLMPFGVLVWALLWGPPAPAPLPLTITFAGAALAAVATLRQARRRRRSDRMVSSLPTRFAAGVLVAMLAALVGVVVATAAPLGERSVLRENPPPPRHSLQSASPLSQLRSSFAADARDRVMMTVTGAEQGELISVATLESYTGEVFAADASNLVRTSGRAAAAPSARQLGFMIEDYSGQWMPTIGPAQSVSFVGDRAAELSQSLMRSGSGSVVLAGLQAGDGYSVMVAPAADPVVIGDLQPAGVVDRSTLLPLSALDWLAARAASDVTPGQALQRTVEALESEGYLSHGIGEDEAPSRAGHSVARIDALFSGEHMIGDQEQFAVAAALMARELGFPSRVGVGYRAPDEGTAEVRGQDATAWVEVQTDQGWVAIEVVPQNTAVPESTSTANQLDTQPMPPVPPELPEGGQPDSQQRGESSNPTGSTVGGGGGSLLAVLVGSIALALLIALPFIAVLAVKSLRRRGRRNSSNLRDRAAGAWSELVDGFVDRGADPLGDVTRAEYAEGDDAVLAFAQRVDRAVFAAAEPAADEVEGLWEEARGFLAYLDRDRSRRSRIASRLSLRSLFLAEPIAAAQRAASEVGDSIRARIG